MGQSACVTMPIPFALEEIPGERWDVALDSIASGGPLVVVEREIAIGFQRHVGWATADGRIHVSAYTATRPTKLSEEAVERDGRAAAKLLADVIERDVRLARLLGEVGFEFDYLYDHGLDAVKIGSISVDGHVTLV